MTTTIGFRGAWSEWLVGCIALGLVILPAVVWLVLSGVRAANGDLQVAMETTVSVESPVSLPDGWEVAGVLPVPSRWLIPLFPSFFCLSGRGPPTSF